RVERGDQDALVIERLPLSRPGGDQLDLQPVLMRGAQPMRVPPAPSVGAIAAALAHVEHEAVIGPNVEVGVETHWPPPKYMSSLRSTASRRASIGPPLS